MNERTGVNERTAGSRRRTGCGCWYRDAAEPRYMPRYMLQGGRHTSVMAPSADACIIAAVLSVVGDGLYDSASRHCLSILSSLCLPAVACAL